MSNNNELLNKLRADLENSAKSYILSKSEIKLATSDMTQLTDTDGIVLYIDGADLTIGASVYTLDENGNLTPADGDHSFEDGREITITDGKISNIGGTPVTPDETQTPVEEMATEPTAAPADAAPTDTKDADFEKRISALEAQVAELIASTETLNNQKDTLLQRVEKLSKEPAATPIKVNKVGTNMDGGNSIVENTRLALRSKK